MTTDASIVDHIAALADEWPRGMTTHLARSAADARDGGDLVVGQRPGRPVERWPCLAGALRQAARDQGSVGEHRALHKHGTGGDAAMAAEGGPVRDDRTGFDHTAVPNHTAVDHRGGTDDTVVADEQPVVARTRKIRQVRARLDLMENAAEAVRRELAELTSGADEQRGSGWSSSPHDHRRPASPPGCAPSVVLRGVSLR